MHTGELEDEFEYAWRSAQGPDVALLYKFWLPVGPMDSDMALCGARITDPGTHASRCFAYAEWKTARSPYSVTGVRYWCTRHCPDVPDGTLFLRSARTYS